MKIERLTVQGFRGFNERRSIDFDERLTLVCAPNSYGKTSISEAFEWLLYGTTSKVERAGSKEEYKGSLRNRHFPEGAIPFVEVAFVGEDGGETQFRGEFMEDESIARFVGGQAVDNWPFSQDLAKVARPFILQHALKYLLLVAPRERFSGFAGLLGLEKLELLQRNVVSLCTKPEACIPPEVRQLLTDVATIEARLENQRALATIQKALARGLPGLQEAYACVTSECRRRVPRETEPESVMPQLLKIRQDAIDRIFTGRAALADYSQEENAANALDEDFFISSVSGVFVKKYTDLIALATVQHVLQRAEFFSLGVKLLSETPGHCPFCGQAVDDALAEHLCDEHARLATERESGEALHEQRKGVSKSLTDLRARVSDYHARHSPKVRDFLALEPVMGKLEAILVPKHETHFREVEAAMVELAAANGRLEKSYSEVVGALARVDASVDQSAEDAGLLKTLGEALAEYVSEGRSFQRTIAGRASALEEADRILKHELDVLARTEDISLLIDLVDRRRDIEKKVEITGILNGLKVLRKCAEQYVAQAVLEAISGALTDEVMEWYGRIKTTGDPDVHFDGFDMGRTSKGDLKAGRIEIKAKSYGKDLVSAVSSLSESKLNALGLCVCVATNLIGESPFDFLIIDDPIQSWDAEHETQFIEVVRRLVERGKQVILMSHNSKWIEQLCTGCRSLNGRFYEITGYTKAGPHIAERPWFPWERRLKEVDAIVKDQTADSVRLQHAEEEIRIVAAELTCELYLKIKGESKSPHNVNSDRARKMLVECGVDSAVVDRIVGTFATTDDAHHAAAGYAPDRQRIRRYYSYCYELAELLGGPPVG